MATIGKLLCVPFCFLGMACAVNAMPDREWEKDYLPNPGLEWNKKFVYFKGFRGSWEDQIRWFAQEAGMEFVASSPLPIICGINPKFQPESKLYSLVEVFDIINEILQGSTRHTLIRSGNKLILFSDEGSFVEWPALPLVQIRDLPGRGNTEVVRMEATFESELIAGQVKKLLGDFGHVAPLGGNRYALRGTVQSLKLVFELCRP